MLQRAREHLPYVSFIAEKFAVLRPTAILAVLPESARSRFFDEAPRARSEISHEGREASGNRLVLPTEPYSDIKLRRRTVRRALADSGVLGCIEIASRLGYRVRIRCQPLISFDERMHSHLDGNRSLF